MTSTSTEAPDLESSGPSPAEFGLDTLSVVSPVYNDVERIASVVTDPRLEGAEFILVADSDRAERYLRERALDWRRRPVTVLRSPGQGPATARNVGLTSATRPYVWFLDSDCTLTSLDLAHLRRCFLDGRVVGLGGSTRHQGAARRGYFARSEIFSPYLAGSPSEAYWAPSANLLVRRTAIRDSSPFPSFYPDKGGGEDVHFCLSLVRFGRLLRTDALVVEHPPWPRPRTLLPKILRWGWAEGIMTARAPRVSGLIPHRFSPAWLAAFLLPLLLIALVALGDRSASLPALLAASLAVFLPSMLLEVVLARINRFATVLHALTEVGVLFAFEFSGLVARYAMGRPDLGLVELRYFPEQPAFDPRLDGVRGVTLVGALLLGAWLVR